MGLCGERANPRHGLETRWGVLDERISLQWYTGIIPIGIPGIKFAWQEPGHTARGRQGVHTKAWPQWNRPSWLTPELRMTDQMWKPNSSKSTE